MINMPIIMTGIFHNLMDINEVKRERKGDNIEIEFTTRTPVESLAKLKTIIYEATELPLKTLEISEVEAQDEGMIFNTYKVYATVPAGRQAENVMKKRGGVLKEAGERFRGEGVPRRKLQRARDFFE